MTMFDLSNASLYESCEGDTYADCEVGSNHCCVLLVDEHDWRCLWKMMDVAWKKGGTVKSKGTMRFEDDVRTIAICCWRNDGCC